MGSEDKHMGIQIQEDSIVGNRKRGDILYYSISQVAALLDEEERSVLYYTNVFDNILKIEISDKRLRYTSKDIDKLEFLINLKNKGMTIKEIQSYCEELPLNIEELIDVKENNSVSVKEIISTIIESEDEKISNLKEYLADKIRESNELSIQKIVEMIMQEQNKQFNLIKNDILSEMKEYIDYKFNLEHEANKDLYDELSTNMSNITLDKDSFAADVKSQLKEYNQISLSRDNDLISEIKRFKNVIEQAYYVQKEMESQTKKVSFIEKLFGVIH